MVILLFWLGLAVQASAEPQLLHSFWDRGGDDVGGGSLSYPLDATFEEGVLDLRRFVVLQDLEYFYFQFQFVHLSNPWNAPEGFYHPRIDLYMDTDPGVGLLLPLRPGPGEIRFSEAHPWDTWLRIAPWDGAALFRYDDAPNYPGRST